MLLVGFVVWSPSFFTIIPDFKMSNDKSGVAAPSLKILIHTVKYSSCKCGTQTPSSYTSRPTQHSLHQLCPKIPDGALSSEYDDRYRTTVTTSRCTCFISVIVCADATICNN